MGYCQSNIQTYFHKPGYKIQQNSLQIQSRQKLKSNHQASVWVVALFLKYNFSTILYNNISTFDIIL